VKQSFNRAAVIKLSRLSLISILGGTSQKKMLLYC